MIDPEVRARGIGGRDIGALFGVDGDRDAFSVWAEKRGGLGPSAVPPSDRMIIGKAMEPGVLKLYEHVTGRRVEYHDQTHQHAERPFQIYTPDAFVIGEDRGVDAKVCAPDQSHKWGPAPCDIPESNQMQAHWYMSATGFKKWDVVVFFGGAMPRVYTFDYDAEMDRVMLEVAREFWRRYLVGDETPEITPSASAAMWLQKAYANYRRSDVREATDEEITLLCEYAKIRVEQKTVTELRKRIETTLRNAVGHHEGLKWPGGRFTWKKIADRKRVDWQSMAIGLLHQYVHDEEQRDVLTELYTSVTPGYRRIWFDSELYKDLAEEAAA